MSKSNFSKSKKYVFGLLGIGISVLVIYLLAQKIDFNRAFNNFEEVSISSILLLALIYISTFFIRAIRWKLMLQDINIPYLTCLSCLVIGFAGNNFLPVRGGELLRMEFFSRKSKINRVTGLSSIFVEKILDGLVLVSFLLIILNIDESLITNDWLKSLTFFSTLLFSFFLVLILI